MNCLGSLKSDACRLLAVLPVTSGDVIPADELERIRNYLAQWPTTVGTNTPEGVPLAKQLLAHIDALKALSGERERLRGNIEAALRLLFRSEKWLYRRAAEVALEDLERFAAESSECTDPCADAGCPVHGDDPSTLVLQDEEIV